MNISDDVEVYKLSKLLQVFGDENNSDFLFEYWVKTNKLRYLPKFLGNSHPSVSSDEVQYVVALETLLESFMDTLNGFFIDRYCSKESSSLSMDPTVTVQCEDLLSELENFQRITCYAGWVELYKDLSEAIAKITTKIDRLKSAYGTGKQFHFLTNISAEDIISSESVDLRRKTGKYFILDNRVG